MTSPTARASNSERFWRLKSALTRALSSENAKGREIVVRTTVQPLHPIFDHPARGEHQGGDVQIQPPDLAAYGKPIETRQHDVEDDEIVGRRTSELQAARTVCRDVNGERQSRETLADEGRQPRFVFDDQDAHGADADFLAPMLEQRDCRSGDAPACKHSGMVGGATLRIQAATPPHGQPGYFAWSDFGTAPMWISAAVGGSFAVNVTTTLVPAVSASLLTAVFPLRSFVLAFTAIDSSFPSLVFTIT